MTTRRKLPRVAWLICHDGIPVEVQPTKVRAEKYAKDDVRASGYADRVTIVRVTVERETESEVTT